MSDNWTFVPSDDETGNTVECTECGRAIAPTEPLFDRQDHVRHWVYLCMDCASAELLDEAGSP